MLSVISVERKFKKPTSVLCPECGKDAAFVVSTRNKTVAGKLLSTLRRYKCRACGHPFKCITNGGK